MNIAKIIKERTALKESEKVVDQLLIELYLRKRLSTKQLGRKVNLPLPIIAAIKKELGKLGIVSEQQGPVLTRKGRLYVEQRLGWATINTAYYLRILDSSEVREALRTELVNELEEGIEKRPTVEVAYDQAFATIETIVERAFLLLENHDFVGKRVLLLGDDDLTSLAIGLLMKKLQRASAEPLAALTVYELSEPIIHCLETTAKKLAIGLTCHQVDFRQGSAQLFDHQFNYIFVDPPYTQSGLALFLSRAVSCSKLGESKIYLSFGEKDPDSQLAVQQLFSIQNLIVNQIKVKFNHYIGASILGSVSTLYELSTQNDSYAGVLADKPYHKVIYTGERNPRSTVYQCHACQTQYLVGLNESFKTIEHLKARHCPKCKGAHFLRIARGPSAIMKEKQPLGEHYLIELKNCPEHRLKSVLSVEQAMLQIVEVCELTAVTHHFHQFEPWGVSGVVILAESHLTIHTWPEERYAAVDLFVCQELSSNEQFISVVADLFEAEGMSYRKIDRGERTQNIS